MVLFAGCAGSSGPATDGTEPDGVSETPGGQSEGGESSLITFRNETENGTTIIRANTTSETYVLESNTTLNLTATGSESESDLAREFRLNLTTNLYCALWNELVYNYSQLPEGPIGATNGTNVSKANVDSIIEGTRLPADMFATYEAETVIIRVFSKDGSEMLSRCTIPEQGDVNIEFFTD
jgi:hypothetical protein